MKTPKQIWEEKFDNPIRTQMPIGKMLDQLQEVTDTYLRQFEPNSVISKNRDLEDQLQDQYGNVTHLQGRLKDLTVERDSLLTTLENTQRQNTALGAGIVIQEKDDRINELADRILSQAVTIHDTSAKLETQMKITREQGKLIKRLEETIKAQDSNKLRYDEEWNKREAEMGELRLKIDQHRPFKFISQMHNGKTAILLDDILEYLGKGEQP